MNKFVNQVKQSLISATDEIKKFCQLNSWLNDIKKYVSDWKGRLFFEWKKNGAAEIEHQLNKIRNWSDDIKKNFSKIVITQNKILKIHTNPIENFLLPKLDTIYKEICESLVTEINKDTLNLTQDINKIIDV